MLNVAFAGNIYNESGTQYTSTEVKYQALFYRSLDGWTKWNDVHVSEHISMMYRQWIGKVLYVILLPMEILF